MDGRSRHPAVVLQVHQRKSSATVGDLIVFVSDATTFDGNATPSQWAGNRGLRKFKYSIPVRDESVGVLFPVEEYQLELHPDSERLKELTYVREQHIWAIPISQPSNYFFVQSHAYSVRLDERSTNILVRDYFGLEPQRYLSVEEVLATAEARLTAMAKAEGYADHATTKRDSDSIALHGVLCTI